ncbi:MAG: SGNH/GDSL hydrolase family protein [Alteraurantiacibacter sp.]
MAEPGFIRRPMAIALDAVRGAAPLAVTPASSATDRLRRALSLIAIPVLALFALAGWLVAPAPLEPTVSPRTVTTLARAPFATRIVIGDSRAYGAPSRGGVLFAAYPGATIEDMARMAQALCLLSDAQIVIALGVNDAKADMRRPAASLAALERMVEGCGRERVWVSEVWHGEPAKLPAGPDFDAATITTLNAGIRQLTASGTGHLIAQPALAGHTRDGIHFDQPTAARYEAMLAGVSAT